MCVATSVALCELPRCFVHNAFSAAAAAAAADAVVAVAVEIAKTFGQKQHRYGRQFNSFDLHTKKSSSAML